MGVIRLFPRVLVLSQLRLCSLHLFLIQVWGARSVVFIS